MGMRSFFNGLVNARMVELEGEHINAKSMNRTTVAASNRLIKKTSHEEP